MIVIFLNVTVLVNCIKKESMGRRLYVVGAGKKGRGLNGLIEMFLAHGTTHFFISLMDFIK